MLFTSKKTLTAIIGLLLSVGAIAQDSVNIVSTAVPFLRISQDARAGDRKSVV